MLTLDSNNQILIDGNPSGVFIMVGEPFQSVVTELITTVGALTVAQFRQLKGVYIQAQG